ncbi:FKBP-type peptidyl-prolyl cis-trans isomerase [Cellulomonas sp. APG4]|uniref:FKBP-type peptidyl-prolyl cis-trans isomerase n=1 Tax=Cellulomonas sp. APG4 TaxID=1538656 RepID=UPI00351B2DDD
MPVRRGRAVVAAAAFVLAAGTLAACGDEPEVTVDVEVTGEAGVVPELTYPQPLEVDEAFAEVVWEGEGPEVTDGEPILLHYYAEDASDGSVVGETFSGVPKAFVMSRDSVGSDIYDALQGTTVGSRVLNVVPAGDQPTTTVAVFDVLPTRASGEAVEPREGLPVVELAADGEPLVTVPEAEPPSDLVVQPLIRGTGAQVTAGQVITVQYTGLTWSDGEVFDSSWAPDELPWPFPIGVGSVVAAWDQGLVEQTVGSQVLLVVPPGLGYGGDDSELVGETQVFVVDILAASGGPTS